MAGTDSRTSPAPLIAVEIVYGKAGLSRVIRRKLPIGSTLAEAIKQSGILEMYPEIDLGSNKVGVYSKKRELYTPARAGDRIEIYQPLPTDPKEARRRRAQKGGR